MKDQTELSILVKFAKHGTHKPFLFYFTTVGVSICKC